MQVIVLTLSLLIFGCEESAADKNTDRSQVATTPTEEEVVDEALETEVEGIVQDPISNPDLAANPEPEPTPIEPVASGEVPISPLNAAIGLRSGQSKQATTLPIQYKVVFSKPIKVDSFDRAQITQSGTATGVEWEVTQVDGKDNEFYLSATAAASSGTIIPTLAAGKVVDTEDQKNASFTDLSHSVYYHRSLVANFTYDSEQDFIRFIPFEIKVKLSNELGVAWPLATTIVISHDDNPEGVENIPNTVNLSPSAQTIAFAAGNDDMQTLSVTLGSARTTRFSAAIQGAESTLKTLDLTISDLSDHQAFGAGSGADPYLIYSPQQLGHLIASNPGDTSEYKLVNDIDMTGAPPPFKDSDGGAISYPEITSVADVYNYSFEGTLDGNNKTIRNYRLSESLKDHVALFPVARHAVFKNLTLENFEIEGANRVGALVAQVNNHIELTNITVRYTLSDAEKQMVKGVQFVGGLLGIIEILEADLVRPASTRETDLPGFVSQFSTFDQISMIGPKILAESSYTGGLGGRIVNADMSQVVISALQLDSIGGSYQGGLAGDCFHCRINRSSTAGALTRTGITGNGFAFGGMIGELWSGVLTNSHSSLVVASDNVGNDSSTGDFGMGGLVGRIYNSSYIYACKATGAVTGGAGLGGLVGQAQNYTAIAASYATGAVMASGNTSGLLGNGGLVGTLHNSHLYLSYSIGAVTSSATATNSNSGGLIGYSRQSEIWDNFSTSQVTGKSGSIDRLSQTSGANNFQNNFVGDGDCTGCSLSNATSANESYFKNLPGGDASSFPLDDQWDGWDDPTDATNDSAAEDLDIWVYENGQTPKLWFEAEAAAAAPAMTGTGVEADPYLIAITDISRAFNPRFVDKHFQITDSGTVELSAQLSHRGLVFSGVMDFNNLEFKDNAPADISTEMGVFQFLPYGTHIKNLVLKDMSFSGQNKMNLGILAGFIHSAEGIELQASTSISTSYFYSGGLAGALYATHYPMRDYHLQNITVASTLGTNKHTGGIVGLGQNAHVKQLEFSGDINSSVGVEVGGLFGSYSSGSIVESKAIGSDAMASFEVDHSNIGGLVGKVTLTNGRSLYIVQSYNQKDVILADDPGNVRNNLRAGGLVGHLAGSEGSTNSHLYIYDSYNSGDISVLGYAGGLIGYHQTADLTIDGSFSSGSFPAQDCGHIVAKFETGARTQTITNTYHDASFTSACTSYISNDRSDGASATAAELQNGAFAAFEYWDFDNLWKENDGFWHTHR